MYSEWLSRKYGYDAISGRSRLRLGVFVSPLRNPYVLVVCLVRERVIFIFIFILFFFFFSKEGSNVINTVFSRNACLDLLG